MPPISFHFRKQQFIFTLKLNFLILCLFFFSLFCLLANWQMHRFHFKKELLNQYEVNFKNTPTVFAELSDPERHPFQSVKIQGHFLNEQTVFVQNQLHEGKLGFEVFTPFQMDNESKLLLIDRGWVAKTLTRTPYIKNSAATHLVGYIKLFNEYQFILGNNNLEPTVFPTILQKMKIDDIAKSTHANYFPFVLRLLSSENDGFIRDWKFTTILPERHLGYAIQWFLLALVVVIGFVCFSCERQYA